MPRLSATQRAAALAVLGLPAHATAEQITRTFRRLAKATHPDVTGRDDAEARDRFSAITEAYARLAAQPPVEVPTPRPAAPAAPTASTAFPTRPRIGSVLGRPGRRSPIVAGPVTISASPPGERPSAGGA